MSFTFDIDVEPIAAMQKRVLALPDRLVKALPDIMEEVMKHLVDRARLNAPVLEGDLRGTIKYQKPMITSLGELLTAIVSDSPYGLRWHEEEFNLGPVSSLQPTTPEGGVGNKYITRAINYRKARYMEVIATAVMLSLLQDKTVSARVKGVR